MHNWQEVCHLPIAQRKLPNCRFALFKQVRSICHVCLHLHQGCCHQQKAPLWSRLQILSRLEWESACKTYQTSGEVWASQRALQSSSTCHNLAWEILSMHLRTLAKPLFVSTSCKKIGNCVLQGADQARFHPQNNYAHLSQIAWSATHRTMGMRTSSGSKNIDLLHNLRVPCSWSRDCQFPATDAGQLHSATQSET